MWRHKLDIENVNIYIVRGRNANNEAFKELVIGYKTIYINTYTVIVTDLSEAIEKKTTMFRHESF